MPPDLRLGSILFLSCLSFCHSVLLSETSTLLITFEQWVFHISISCDLDLGVWPIFWNFNLAKNFWTVSARALIFHSSIPCDKTFLWVPLFFTLWTWPLSLTLFLKNFNHANNLLTVSARALIFYMRILSVGDLDLGVWPISF